MQAHVQCLPAATQGAEIRHCPVQIDQDPRRFKLSLKNNQFMVLYFVGPSCLCPPVIMLDSYSEFVKPICATMPGTLTSVIDMIKRAKDAKILL